VLGTENVAKGNLAYQIEPESKDEIGQLAASFNKMTEDLHTVQEELVRKARLAALGQLTERAASGCPSETRR
jgi:nitrogen fixation/metabolism regulation signal transduction histidine kinase